MPIPVSISPFLSEGSFFVKPVIRLEDHIRQNDNGPQGEPHILQIPLQIRDTWQPSVREGAKNIIIS